MSGDKTSNALDETFDALDGADIILRALGPPKRDFRVHKTVLSLASLVFKDMFSLPQPTSGDSGKSTVAEVEIVEVTDPAKALDIILRFIYPSFILPSLDGDFDALVECLVIADKYDIRRAKSELYKALVRADPTLSLRVYAVAVRFGFTDLMNSTSRHIISSVHLGGISELPNDFDFVSVTAYHKLVRQRAGYLEAVARIIKPTPPFPWCSVCPWRFAVMEGVPGLNLAYLIIAGTPIETGACFGAWVKAYGPNSECKSDCVQRFIDFAISNVDFAFSRVDRDLVKTGTSPLQKQWF